MTFFRRLGRRFTAWMSGRNGIDQLAFASLVLSLIFQLVSSVTGIGFWLLISIALYGWSLFRIFAKKSYKREDENKQFVMGWENVKTKIRQYFLRLKLGKQYKYFKCPHCKTPLRLNRGAGAKSICCPKCKYQFHIKA